MTTSALRTMLLWLLPATTVCALGTIEPKLHRDQSERQEPDEQPMRVHYLELVTPDVDAMCDSLEDLHGVSFSDPKAELGNARTATLEGGSLIGVRAPMHAAEEHVVRPYVLVQDIASAVETAKAAGHEIAVPPMELQGRGKIAIYVQGGIEHGLWQR